MNNLLLTKEQIEKITELQTELDIRVRENNDIPMEQDLNLEKYIALKTELFEFINEIESFKYWKKNKGKSHILEEACDTMHFIFSLAIENGAKIELGEEVLGDIKPETFDLNDLIGIIDANITDIFIEHAWEDIFIVLTLLLIMINKCGFTANDLYEEYIRKNQINHERQANNY